ncbi:hypothetical protein Micbo1qcDRAFT_168261 [Microdochium bolleyi]|uniref:Uncharacterized protein n=1 Tax=Microdochium bolleyi TaxID=196109 RepID=A0A136IPD2_9PEZI|nr:hypothetical protein Micbo1qcDRAFT_168261 [Microdochium bolleyi]
MVYVSQRISCPIFILVSALTSGRPHEPSAVLRAKHVDIDIANHLRQMGTRARRTDSRGTPKLSSGCPLAVVYRLTKEVRVLPRWERLDVNFSYMHQNSALNLTN